MKAAERRDRGEVTTTVIMVPVVLLATLLVVQFSLAYYARQVVSGAVDDGAAAAARLDSSPSSGADLAESLIDEAAGSLFTSTSATATSTDEVVTVTARGRVVSLLPFFGTVEVSATSSARLERFEAQRRGP